MKPDPATPARPRGRPRSFDRDAALEAAMDVFWAKGYEATSIHDLVDAMGINPPSLYAAFGDKEKLYLAAVERYQDWRREQLGQALDDEPTARAAIERLLHDAACELCRPGHPAGCMLAMSATCTSTSAITQVELAGRRAMARRRIKERIDRGVKEGDVRAGTDTGELADFYTTVLTGMAMRAKDGASRKAMMASVETAMRAWPEPPAARARPKAAPASRR